MGLTPTTLEDLGDKLVAQILGTSPRIARKGVEDWKHYERAAASPGQSRRFRLLWEPEGFIRGGIFTTSSVEAVALLRVRTDYSGRFETLAHLIQDDWHQLRDRMHALTADPANGLILVLQGDRPRQGRSEQDAIQVDLVYQIRYLQARG